ncbi:MAG: 2,5-diamino-6-(ribosylamino)-4(3H)-pyrimidinone 5'-phosphate reductase [Dehalococcoidia bacterium]
MTFATGKPDYTALDLGPAPRDRPYVLVNMVMSADGKVVLEGTEQGIGSEVDQRLMREIRANVDIILNGAGTFRASGTSPRLRDPALEQLRRERGQSPVPIGAVLTRSGNLDTSRIFFTADDFDAVVFVTRSTPAERRRALEATGRRVIALPDDGTLPAMLRFMRHDLGAVSLLVEGGPTLNGDLFRLGAVDEYFLTLGPVIVNGDDLLTAVAHPHPFGRDEAPRLTLLSAFANPETDELYVRYRVEYPLA